MTQRQISPARLNPRPAADAPAAAHIAWLIDLDNNIVPYWPIDDHRVIPTGEPLPFKKLIDPNTKRFRGRFGTVAEEREAHEEGVLPQDERLVFMMRRTRPPGGPRLCSDDFDDIWRMSADDIDQMMSLPTIDHERAGKFTSRCLANRFQRRVPYALTSMNSERVLWASIELKFEKPVAGNLKRLSHFRNSEVLNRLVHLGGVFYLHANDPYEIFYFVAFISPASIDDVCVLERALPFAFGLGAWNKRTVRTSYMQEFDPMSTVSGPTTGACFDPTTGTRLTDDTWRNARLVNPAHLTHLELPIETRAWSIPSIAECDHILNACGLHSKTDWGFCDCWDGSSDPIFKTIRPEKQYGDVCRPFLGPYLTGQLYHETLLQGREFFATSRNYDESQWLCVDFDVCVSSTRIVVDASWLESHLCHERAEKWSAFGIHPEFRYSGQGVYVEFFFDQPIPRLTLKALGGRLLSLFACERVAASDRKRFEGRTFDGQSIIQDVSNLSHVIRLPGSSHRKTGGISLFRDGSLLPPSRRSSRQGLEQLLATVSPVEEETPSIYTLDHKEEKERPVLIPSTHKERSRQDAELDPQASGSVMWKPLHYVIDGHLILNARQRSLLVDAIVKDLLTRNPGQRGPSPDPIPYRAAASVLIDQVCRTAEPFHLGTRQIQSRISEVGGRRERARNRAAVARQALVDAQYIRLVKGHEVRDKARGFSGSAALYSADLERLLLMAKEVLTSPAASEFSS